MKTWTRSFYGCYVQVLCCGSCKWFYTPSFDLNLLPPIPQPIICPVCGSDLVHKPGRFENKTTTVERIFRKPIKTTITTGFLPKERETDE